MASIARVAVFLFAALVALSARGADASAFLATDKNFDAQVLGSGKHAFVKFLAPWCARDRIAWIWVWMMRVDRVRSRWVERSRTRENGGTMMMATTIWGAERRGTRARGRGAGGWDVRGLTRVNVRLDAFDCVGEVTASR